MANSTSKRIVDVHARHSDHLLRRRNRNGRQRLPRRSKWCTHSDAMEWWLERWLLGGRSGTLVLALDFQSRLRLSGYQRGIPEAAGGISSRLDVAVTVRSTIPPRLS